MKSWNVWLPHLLVYSHHIFRPCLCVFSLLGFFNFTVLFRSFDVDNTGFITQAQLESLITSVSSQMDPENPDKYSSMGVLIFPRLPSLRIINILTKLHWQSGVVGTDPLGVRVIPVSVFVSQVFAHLCITTGRLSLDQFRQAVIAEPRLIVSIPSYPSSINKMGQKVIDSS